MRVFHSDLTFSAMAARSELNPARWRRRFWPLLDGIEAGWAIPLLLTRFVAVWIAYLVIAYLVGDLHFDVLEARTLGRSFAWGSSKHPPLMGWVARVDVGLSADRLVAARFGQCRDGLVGRRPNFTPLCEATKE